MGSSASRTNTHLPSHDVVGTYDGEPEASPSEILKGVTPPDDAGAATYDRYDWQAVMAAADVLAAYLGCLDDHGTLSEDTTFEVICEHHEDWALSNGYAAEIVSAKHKETSVGAFTTIRNLLVDGGVLHLIDRWIALDRSPTCRLVTTAGLAGDVRALASVAREFAGGSPDGQEYDDIMTKFVEAVEHARGANANNGEDTNAGGGGPVGDRETLAAFLAMFRIDDSQPSRDHVGLMAAGAYAQPVANKLAVPTAANAIWSAILGLVRERMRAAGPRPRGRLPVVLGGRDETGYEARTITLQDVIVAVRVGIENQAGFAPLPRRVRTSRVAIKMTAGGCSDNAVERAQELRRQYREYWRELRATPSTGPAQRRVENDLLRVIDETTELVRLSGQDWGPSLWQKLQACCDFAVASDQSHGLDSDLLLGGVSDLTNECKAWFSDAFDVDAAAHLLIDEAIGTDSHIRGSSDDGIDLEAAGEAKRGSV
jgi:hypothetical protein